MNITKYTFLLLTLLAACCNYQAQGEEKKAKKHRIENVYFSWGYNSEWYTRSTVHITQSEFGNDYDLVQVHANDHKGWNNKSIFKQALTIPQYNYRLGFYFNEKHDLGFEINFDHTKYLITDNQNIRIKGTKGGAPIDTTILFSEKNGFYYFLNNGANFLLFNLVKRWGIYHKHENTLAIDLTGKVGVGPVIPHVENKLFGLTNDMGFQFGGWNTGLETALRVTVKRYAFIEFSQKVDYARYSNLKVASGTAKQNFGTYELILSLGFNIPTNWHKSTTEKEK